MRQVFARCEADRANLKKNGLPIAIQALLFLTPFCYPFRPIVSRLVHLHVYVVMYSSLFLLIIILFFKIKKIRITRHIGSILLYYAIFLFFSPDLDSGLKWVVNIFVGMALGNVFYYYKFRLIDSFPFIIGAILCGIFIQTPLINKLPVSLGYNSNYIRAPFLDGDISIGPNSWAFTVSICILFSALIFFTYKSLKIKIIAITCILILIKMLVLTQSRTGIYTLIVCSFLLLLKWSARKNGGMLLQLLHFFLIFGSVLIVAVIIVSPAIFFSGNSRITSFDFNGRIQIWIIVLGAFFRMNPLQWVFGVGTGGASVYVIKKSSDIYAKYFNSAIPDHLSTHNTYLDSLISSGFLGAFIVFSYWIKAFVHMFRRKECLLFVFPAFALITGLTGNIFMTWDYCILIAMVEYQYLLEDNAKETMIWVRYRE